MVPTSSISKTPGGFSRSVTIAGILGLVVTTIAGWYALRHLAPAQYDEIERAISEERLEDAEHLGRSWIEQHPDDFRAMLDLGRTLQRLGSPSEALQLFRRVAQSAGPESVAAQLSIVSLLLRDGQLAEAERLLLALKPNESERPIADGLWVTLLTLSGRLWESIPYLHKTIDVVGDRRMQLIYLANIDEVPAPPQEVLASMLRVRDPLCLLGAGRIATSLGRTNQALELIKQSLLQRPPLIETQLALGELLLKTNDLAQFETWLRNLPPSADEHPTTWFLRGEACRELNRRPEAIRCYWEVLVRQPNHDRATYQLSQMLAADGRRDEAAVFGARAKALTSLIQATVKLYENLGGEQEVAECARLTCELGRFRECAAWCKELKTITPSHPVLVILEKSLSRHDASSLPWLDDDSNLARKHNLSSYPVPIFAPGELISRQRGLSADHKQDQIQFIDEASKLGIAFTYFNGATAASHGKRMFEFTGGGVAALDFDQDGWCDLYFTQGTDWPVDLANRTWLDAMYRNVATSMRNVTEQLGIQDAGFSQGVTAGDFNNDGFPDLYVANIGGNRLYQNQGDGTYTDVTSESGLHQQNYWTTSCLMADLDGDGAPDLYDVTYLEGDDVYTRICLGEDGVPASCLPELFPASVDHVYRNLGNGKFEEVTSEWGFDSPNGAGLGIVAADFDDSSSISLFIANDGRPNFFFTPERTSSGRWHWNETGVISGLAYDDAGAAQACMGVAAGDANNDNRVDLFVTNFYNQSNTLYINLGSRTFTDRTRTAGLRDPSWSMLGFGTQFLDANHDGWDDLILVNGHVDDFSHKQIPYRMRPQFFENRQGRFDERFGKSLGEFFDTPRLGRGLAKLDWNRDGLTDIAISHLGEPSSLLTNRTLHPENAISFRLVGTAGSRDAVGTRVTVKTQEREWTRQLTAGDGYHASNERRIEFGLGDIDEPVDVAIHWIGGDVAHFVQVPAKGEYLAIQGRSDLLKQTTH